MVVALSFCHKDAELAIGLLKWVRRQWQAGYPSGVKCHVPIVLVPSRYLADSTFPKEASEIAGGVFDTVLEHIPWIQDERGWPFSCNYQFIEALKFVEEKFERKEDTLYLEPDSVTMRHSWLSEIIEEFEVHRRPFMGNLSTYMCPHMTGIGVYGRNWRIEAPSLLDDMPHAWDIHTATEVLPKMHRTDLIQNVNRKDHQHGFGEVDPRAVIFHQDKTGTLIKLLEAEL